MLDTTDLNAMLLEALAKQGVRFLLVGGFAVQFYCPGRDTSDIDLLLEPSVANAERVLSALAPLQSSLHFTLSEVSVAQLVKPKAQLPLKNGANADLLTPEVGFPFDRVYDMANVTTLNGVTVRVPIRDDLISLKSTDRATDREDILLLRQCSDA